MTKTIKNNVVWSTYLHRTTQNRKT